MIRQRHYSPEYSVSRALRHYAKVIQSLDGDYMPERATDIFDIEKRLLRHLFGKRREELAHINAEVLVLAHNLTPSETSNLNPKYVKGFVTEIGGAGSHTAIVAEALGIPAVVGIGPFLTERLGRRNGDHRRLPGPRDSASRTRRRSPAIGTRSCSTGRTRPSSKSSATCRPKRPTACGFSCLGNIEFPYEVEQCQKRGANGIGLYRTEFLFMSRDEEPTEEEQTAAYSAVAKAMRGSAGRDADDRPGRRQAAERSVSRGREQSVPRAAEHSAGAQEPGLVPHAAAGDPAGERDGQHQHHVSAREHAAGAEARQDGAARGERGPGRGRRAVRPRHQSRHDGRGAVGRDDAGSLRAKRSISSASARTT